MDNIDFEIELQDDSNQEASKAKSVKVPRRVKRIGKIGKDDVRIYIRREVFEALEKYAATDTKKEIGSFLLGDFRRDIRGRYQVIISDYVEAKYTDSTRITLTYTHETWNDYYEVKERLYPDKKLVGWQHTHPSFGVFLSAYDLFIQENTFDLPFQVAYVIDPIRQARGFFAWKNGVVNPRKPLEGYYIYE